ncbi:hypothetical protein SDC9_210754 [bioreactor metagenome]|uniref:Uncharacterized protein n=1 Tax=bioreactor metagenome TaxID=1076179 RepID=A0A645JIQ7_9ZZZZ
MPLVDAVNKTTPDFCFSILLSASLEQRNIPPRLMPMTFDHCSKSVSFTRFLTLIPALDISTSMPPMISSTFKNPSFTLAGSLTSTLTPPVKSGLSFKTFFRASSFQSNMTTFAPSLAKRLAVAKPMPLAPQVTTTLFP